MICGIVDLGSNTIRLSIYQYENKSTKLLLNKKVVVGLSGYVIGRELSLKGIKKACSVLNNYKSILENFHIEYAYVFATASLRNISNTEEAVALIKENTGYTVDVLSGEEEAELDFIGATHAVDFERGILVDIGGGSTEIVTFQQREIMRAVSMPIGSLNLFLHNVPGLLPTEGGIKKIKQEILSELKKVGFSANKKLSMICGVGGTVRGTGKLYNDLYEMPSDNTLLEQERLNKMLDLYRENSKEFSRRILQICPDRIHTIIPGMILLHILAKKSKSERIIISRYGVREGYLYHKVLKI